MSETHQMLASLVESIPKGLEDLRGSPGIQYTEDVLVRLTRAATRSIDLTAMYWNLLPDPSSDDEKGFTEDQFEAMGAGSGRALLDALYEAAGRGVRIRILQSPGFSGKKQESDTLAEKFPAQVSLHSITMGDWYGGGGIMHQKLWIFDTCHIYIGSANMDWKSIMQVKEMGVVAEDAPALATDATRYFENWLDFTALKPESVVVHDPAVHIDRKVPPWSALAPAKSRTVAPFGHRARYHRQDPLEATINGEAASCYITGCPREIMGPGRSFDGDTLVETILEARKSVSIAVMDFAPISLYSRTALPDALPTDTPVWWPALFDAVLTAALTHRVHVRLLISAWAHTSALISPFLQALQATGDAGRMDKVMSSGQLEIKRFIIPGWDSTTGSYRKYPGHSRVNHTKYIVTDRRINIGTSNMTWDYFASTAGCSFNSDAPSLIQNLQGAFDRDWASRYAFRLS